MDANTARGPPREMKVKNREESQNTLAGSAEEYRNHGPHTSHGEAHGLFSPHHTAR